MMPNIHSFNVTYDPRGDVLYISARKIAASRGVEDKFGIVWRYGPDGELIGATIVDFFDLWSDKGEVLAGELARHFGIPEPQALNVVEHALEAKNT
jgi:uncharacterized protein YuzE